MSNYLLKGIKILIGPASFGAEDQRSLNRLKDAGFEIIQNSYKRRFTKEELLKFLTDDVPGLIAGLETLDREVLEKTNLKVISRCGAGISNIDLQAAKELDIKVCYTPFGPTTAVAELTMAALLSLLRSMHIMIDSFHQGKWARITGYQLEGKTVAIIGFGRIGRKLATLLVPFGVKIIAVDTVVGEKVEGVRFCSLKEALSEADIVSIHVSGSEELIGKNEFRLIKKGVFLLNAARGEVINEDSLIEALESGKIKGAWLDVFAQEPYTGRLQRYPQVLLTPHVGSFTVEGRAKMEMETVNNLITVFKEKDMITLKAKGGYYLWKKMP